MKFQSISPILPNFFMFSVMHGGPTRIVEGKICFRTTVKFSRSEVLGQPRLKQGTKSINSAEGLTHVTILWIGLPSI